MIWLILEVNCSECGASLDADERNGTIRVPVCETCKQKAIDKVAGEKNDVIADLKAQLTDMDDEFKKAERLAEGDIGCW
jgi:uncharacterized Zn finger protein (UPF0148 family)